MMPAFSPLSGFVNTNPSWTHSLCYSLRFSIVKTSDWLAGMVWTVKFCVTFCRKTEWLVNIDAGTINRAVHSQICQVYSGIQLIVT